MGTVIKFGFDFQYNDRQINKLSKLTSSDISIHSEYHMLKYIFVQMDDDIHYGNELLSIMNEIPNVVVFTPKLFSIHCDKFNRYQFPLLNAHARTVHSAQGITAKQSVIFQAFLFFEKVFTFALCYVALSRIGKMLQLHLLENIKERDINIPDSYKFAIEKEYKRLHKIINIT